MSPRGIARFYDAVDIAEEGGGFAVRLDGKPVRTPGRAVLVLPTKKLADAVADEWRGAGQFLDPAAMPLTGLAYAATDTVAAHRARIREEIAAYGRADLLCYRAEAPAALAVRQAEAWDPLLDWAAECFGARLKVGAGIGFVKQPAESLARLTAALEAHDDFVLAALHGAASLTGSLVLALALAEARLRAKEAFALSRLDEAFQNEAWGRDAEAEARAGRLERELEALEHVLRLACP